MKIRFRGVNIVCAILSLALLDYVSAADTLSFEDVGTGEFEKLDTTVGVWTRKAGNARIDGKHAKTGRRCLHLMGGQETSVVLTVADGVDTGGELSFWAERWTRRTPFSFRIEKDTGSGWNEIFNGDNDVRVGRAFLSRIRIPLNDDRIQRLRFRVTSPDNAGILIDDVRIAVPQKQRIVSIEVHPLTLPALISSETSPLLKLKVETIGEVAPISLIKLNAMVKATADHEGLSSLRVYHSTGAKSRLRQSELVASANVASDQFTTLSVDESRCRLAEGTNYIWVTGDVSSTASIDGELGAACRQLTFSNGKTVDVDSSLSMQRLGVALRRRGDDDVHSYRIPGLATTNNGTLIGVYDVRWDSRRDLPGNIDVGMSRSTDGGQTWDPMKVIMDMGADPNWNCDGIGDPAVLIDRVTGTIWVAATWSHGNRSWVGSGPGLTPEETGQLMLVRSDDDGVTWSKPINITTQVKQPEWSFLLQGPGKGITMSDGTIVFAAQYQDPPDESDSKAHRLPHSTIIYSKDHGKTWQAGTGAFDDTTEAQVVEAEPGVLMLNCRYNRQPTRVVMTTRDMGKTWQRHATSEKTLREPGQCMASLIDIDDCPSIAESDGRPKSPSANANGWLLFSNPDSTHRRHRIMIKASPDRGATWPAEHQLLLDEELGSGYSCMTMIDSNTVGILYEGSQADMTFQRVPLNEIVGEAD